MNVVYEFLITLSLGLGAGLLTRTSLMFILQRSPTFPAQWSRLVSARRIAQLFVVMVSIYVVIFAAISIMRFQSFALSVDLAQYDQLVWNSLRGRLLENTFVPDAPLFLGKSFVPILLMLVPLFTLWNSPLVLSILQPLAFSAGAFPIYWFARKQVGDALAFGVTLAYLLFPVLVQSNLEFHEIALATPLLAYATFFLLRRHYPACFAMLAVALLVKEELAFVVAGFGVYIFFFQKRRWLGLAVFLFGLAWSVLLLYFLIPFFQNSAPGKFYYFSSGQIAGGASRYGYLGTNLLEIVQTVLTRPTLVLQHVIVPEKIEFVLHLLVPLLFLPLLGADIAILALPTLTYSLLSEYSVQYSIQTYYPAPLVPFLFFATIVGLRHVLRWRGDDLRDRITWRGTLLAMLLTTSSITYLLYTSGPLARGFQPDQYSMSMHDQLGISLTHTIPDAAVTVVQDEFLAHLSQRQFIYEIPVIPDYRQADYLFADPTRQWYNVHAGFWSNFLSTGYFEIITRQDGYLIAKRVIPTAPKIRFGNALTLLGCSVPATTTITGGMTLRPIVAWQIDKPIEHRYKFAVQVVDAAGHVWASDDQEPQDGNLPTTQWQVGRSIGDQYALNLPPTMPTGDYAITLFVHSATEDVPLDNETQIASLHIEKNKHSFTASELQIEQPLYVDMQEMRFLGNTFLPQTMNRNDRLSIGLYWRARSKPQGDYLAVVQLRDDTGKIAFEQSARPVNNTYPTTEWNAGEVLLDWHDIILPSNLATGNFQIVVILRDASTGKSLGETVISALSVVN